MTVYSNAPQIKATNEFLCTGSRCWFTSLIYNGCNNKRRLLRTPHSFYMSAPQHIELFVDKLLAEKGMAGALPTAREAMKEELLERLQTIVDATILQHLPDEKMVEFEKMLDNKSTKPEAFEKFCRDNIQNLDEIIAATLVTFRARYLGDLATSH